MGGRTRPLSFMDRGAEFSPDRIFRYLLWRKWERELPIINFIGLNPSTADENKDDPTIRRCLRFARDWGYGQLVMTNLFAFRATKPRDLWLAKDLVGPDNNNYLVRVANLSGLVVVAWGADATPAKLRRVDEVRRLLGDRDIHHLGLSQAGHPRHPLYLKADTRPELWK